MRTTRSSSQVRGGVANINSPNSDIYFSAGTSRKIFLSGGTNDGQDVTITGGNVGIGTTTPTTKLHAVEQNATTDTVLDVLHLQRLTTGTAANNIGAGILFSSEDTLGASETIGRISGILTAAAHGSETGALTFSTRSPGSAIVERMRIAGDGTVQIGATLSEGFGLNVQTSQVSGIRVRATGNAGGSEKRGLDIELNGTGTQYGIFASLSGATFGVSMLPASLQVHDSDTTAVREMIRLFHDSSLGGAGGIGNGTSITFYGTDSVSSQQLAGTISTILRIPTHGAESGAIILAPVAIDPLSPGRVGIGSSMTPDQVLDVAGNILASTSGNVDLILKSTSATGDSGSFSIRSAGASERLDFLNQSTTLMTIASTGAITMPGLSATGVTDNFVCRNPTTGEITFGATCAASSRRFKTNIEDLSHGLDWVRSLRPVTFDWKHNGEPSLGFIAEEVASLSPLLAHYQDGKVYSVNYQIMTAVLAKAVQELNGKIEGMAQNGPISFDEESLFERFVMRLQELLLTVKGVIAETLETRDGVTTYDKETGEPFCMIVSDGEVVARPGKCGATVEPAPIPDDNGSSDEPLSEPTEEPTPEATPEPEPTLEPTPEESPAEESTPEPEPAPAEEPAPANDEEPPAPTE